jgi:hypothetical protein
LLIVLVVVSFVSLIVSLIVISVVVLVLISLILLYLAIVDVNNDTISSLHDDDDKNNAISLFYTFINFDNVVFLMPSQWFDSTLKFFGVLFNGEVINLVNIKEYTVSDRRQIDFKFQV